MDRAQGLEEKNGVICPVMFTPRVMIFQMSEMSHFEYFLLMTAKNSLSLGKIL